MSPRPFSPQGTWVAIDVETTGLDPQVDRIIELGAVRFSGGAPVASFGSLVDPGRPLPAAVVSLTGLTDADLAGAPAIEQVLPSFATFVGQDPLVGHNLAFDLAFLEQAGRLGGPGRDHDSPGDGGGPPHCGTWVGRTDQPDLDTLLLARILLPGRPSYSLPALLVEAGFGRTDGEGHRAAVDALAAGRLVLWLTEQGLAYPEAAMAAAAGWLEPAAAQFPGLVAFLAGLESVRPEVQSNPVTATRRSGAAGGGKQTSGAEATASHPEGPVPRGGVDELIDELFEANGRLATVIDDYERRPEQTEMSRAILRALGQGTHLAVEAGTGIGKSLAYLAPALAAAEATGERVLISTNTLTLQDQLTERDLPVLAAALGRPVNFAVLKGRANYLCRRKWHELLGASLTADPVERVLGLRLIFWGTRTPTGELSELGLTGQEEALRWLVSGDENCWGSHCPHAAGCFVNQARRRAEQSDLVIANHALVCTNLVAGGRLLPDFAHLILDEAHHFAGVATEHLGLVAGHGELAGLVAAAGGRGARGSGKSLAALRAGSRQPDWPSPAALQDLNVQSQRVQADLRTFFRALGGALAGGSVSGDGNLRAAGMTAGAPPAEVRYGPRMTGLPPGALELGLAAAAGLEQLGKALGRLAEGAPSPGAGLEIGGLAKTLAIQAAGLESLCRAEADGWVYWLEEAPQGPNLRGVPVDVAGALRTQLWSSLSSVILVSATLTVQERFEHILGQLGLAVPDSEPAASLLLHSPFDYRSQALLCVPTDLPLPGSVTDQVFVEACAEFLADLLPAAGGRSLVLFTSHRALRLSYSLLAEELAAQGLDLYAQGVHGDRSRLLRALRSEERAVVFGSATFWEGIDVRGPQLSCLVIAKLPFPRPDEPVVAARQEKLTLEGKAAFAHYSLPQAVLRLRQGFGRLIRSGQDRGAVVILDARLLRRRYGEVFLRSLPRTSRCFAPGHQVTREVGDWLAGEAVASRSGVTWVRPPEGANRTT